MVMVVYLVEQATAPTVYASYEIPGRSGFAFHSSHFSKALSGLVAIK